MKYSFIMPYFKRAKQFVNTLKSFQKFYGTRNDWEIILIEDGKNHNDYAEHERLMQIYQHFSGGIAIKYAVAEKSNVHDSSTYRNQAARMATGTYLVQTSPECLHTVDILHGFDVEFWLNPDKYIVCGCQDETMPNGWRHHSVHHPSRFHYCSALSKENYERIGGFDEKYSEGIAYDDNDFLCKILFDGKMTLVERDDLVVIHQLHDKEHMKLPNRRELWLKNRNYFIEKWKEFGKANTIMG